MQRVRHLLPAVVAAGLVFAGTAAAEGPPRTPPGQRSDPPAASEMLRYVQTMLCVKEARSLGLAAFLAEYGHKDPMRACRAAQRVAAQTLIANAKTVCATARNRLMCVKRTLIASAGPAPTAKGQGSDSQASDSTGLGKGSPQPNEPSRGTGSPQLVLYVETALCVSEGKTLGRTAFLAKYGQQDPLGACRAAQQAAAQAVVTAATTSCSSDENPIVCVKHAIVTAVGQPTDAPARP